MKAVVVDDSAASASVIAKLLALVGCESLVCTDPVEAVSLALSAEADVLTLDIAMPGFDGYQVLSLLRSHEHSRRLPSLPVIAITGKGLGPDRATSLATGFAAHVVKPVFIEDLEHALQLAQALRGELTRTRSTSDQTLIDELLRLLLVQQGGERLRSIAGLALTLEAQGLQAIRDALTQAYAGRRHEAAIAVEALQRLAGALGATRLSELCRRFGAALAREIPGFEVAAVLLRAELDRVVFTLRERALA